MQCIVFFALVTSLEFYQSDLCQLQMLVLDYLYLSTVMADQLLSS